MLLFVMFALPTWGIIHCFLHHSATRGLLALLIPPYAAYEGVAYLWESPRWERDWEDNCEVLGATVLRSIQDDTDPQIVAMQSAMKGWIATMPDERRDDLRDEVQSLGGTFIQYWENVLADTAFGRPLRSMTDDSLRLPSAPFMRNVGLERIWGRWVEKQAAVELTMARELSKLSPARLQELAQAGTPESRDALERTLDELFGGHSG